MKFLSGRELAGFIKQRQTKQVRALVQARNISPRLAIVQTKDDPVINTYVRLKKSYGKDIMIDVEALTVRQEKALETIKNYNDNPSVSGIIVQLPLSDTSQTETVIKAISPTKDVDGLCEQSPFSPATAVAIDWLVSGYNVTLANKRIVIIGSGRLVGQPLCRLWQAAGYDVTMLGRTDDLARELKHAEIIVTATGIPGLLKSEIIPIGAVVVDAGVASESGKTVGDVAPDVYQRSDLMITPKIGGVGPLTVAALFDNLIRAAAK